MLFHSLHLFVMGFSRYLSVKMCLDNTVLTLYFAVLTDDKAATAKNDRTQENPPERVGKGYVFSVSSGGTY